MKNTERFFLEHLKDVRAKTFLRTDFLIKRSLLSSKAKINFCPKKFEGGDTVLVFETKGID